MAKQTYLPIQCAIHQVIIAIDDGIEVRRWTVSGAWIGELSYSDFNTGSGELVEETAIIHWDDLEETWLVG